MKRYFLLFLSFILVFLACFPVNSFALGADTIIRVVAGESAERAIISVATRAGIKNAEKRAVQRWNLDLYRSYQSGEMWGAGPPIRMSRERAAEIVAQLNQKPTPIPQKPGWGKIALDAALFLTGVDLFVKGKEAYDQAQQTEEKKVFLMTHGYDPDGADMYSYGGAYWQPRTDALGGMWNDLKYQGKFLISYKNSGPIVEVEPDPIDSTGIYVKYWASDSGPLYETSKWTKISQSPQEMPDIGKVPAHYPAVYPSHFPFPSLNPAEVPEYPTDPGKWEVGFPKVVEIAVPLPNHNPSPKEWEEMNPVVRPGVVPPIPGTNPNPEPKPTPVPEPVPSPVPFPDPVPVPDPVLPIDPPGDGSPEPAKWSKKFKSLVTTRFPFSLPWDAYFLLSIIAAEPKSPKVSVDRDFHVGSFSLPFKFSYDFSNLDPYMAFFRGMILVGFGFALVFATSRFFGGAK